MQKLKSLKFNVIGLDWKPSKYTKIVQDITKPFEINEKIDIIIHLVAKTEQDRSSKQEYFSTNVKGTENVLQIAKKHNSYFIYISTAAVYGSPSSPITEKTLISPNGYCKHPSYQRVTDWERWFQSLSVFYYNMETD